jgi:hypothetical protein
MVNTFERTGIYRHSTSKDLDILVVSVTSFNDTFTRLRVKWVSKRDGKIVIFPEQQINGTSDIEIQNVDKVNWTKL